jgi:hypothetical protein
MKKITQFLAAGILFGLIFLSSCAKEETPGPSSSDPRAAFNGHWFISEQSSASGSGSYYVDITDSSNASFILFAYLYGYQTKVRATVSGTVLTIPSQVVEGNNVSGSGTLTNANQINMNYLVWLGGSSYDTVKAVLSK